MMFFLLINKLIFFIKEKSLIININTLTLIWVNKFIKLLQL